MMSQKLLPIRMLSASEVMFFSSYGIGRTSSVNILVFLTLIQEHVSPSSISPVDQFIFVYFFSAVFAFFQTALVVVQHSCLFAYFHSSSNQSFHSLRLLAKTISAIILLYDVIIEAEYFVVYQTLLLLVLF